MQTSVVVLAFWAGAELVVGANKGIRAWRERRTNTEETCSVHGIGRSIAVVSTAAIPWMTGTAVNPCLRAAYLAELTDSEVKLVVPWLEPKDQKLVFPSGMIFEKPVEQEACIRQWIWKRTGLTTNFQIIFYTGRYDKVLLGVFPVGNLVKRVAEEQADMVVLEEPEHICWFHYGGQWTNTFRHVVGVMHTNQVELGRRNAGPLGVVMAAAAYFLTFILCEMHCHKVIKLSDTLQTLPKQKTCFVHAAAAEFLKEGSRKAKSASEEKPIFGKGAYALGKVVWGKGWEELLKLLEFCKTTDSPCPATSIDCYGDGEARKTVGTPQEHNKHQYLPSTSLDEESCKTGLVLVQLRSDNSSAQIEKRAVKLGLPLTFHDKIDHLDSRLHTYRVFVNASTSDVVATTSIEALAMGKWLICAHHPCNSFASRFPNTLVYHSPAEFCELLQYALENDPHPLDEDTLRELGWEAATERFLQTAEIAPSEWPSLPAKVSGSMLWTIYKTCTAGLEGFRRLACGGLHRNTLPYANKTTSSLQQEWLSIVFRGDGWTLGSCNSGYCR